MRESADTCVSSDASSQHLSLYLNEQKYQNAMKEHPKSTKSDRRLFPEMNCLCGCSFLLKASFAESLCGHFYFWRYVSFPPIMPC